MNQNFLVNNKARAFAVLAMAISTSAVAAPATQPGAASVLAAMDSAYAKLQSAEFDGHIIGRFDVAGQQKNEDALFTSTFHAPNQFRHESQNDVLLGSTGTKVYSFLTNRAEYQSGDSPKTLVPASQWPASASQILQMQNPSLLLAISKSASAEINEMSKQITVEPATVIDGISYDTLQFTTDSDQQTITMLVDPATHLLHEVKFDLKKSLEQAGAADVKLAQVTVEYTKSVPDAPVTAGAFAWTAPAGAMLAGASTVLVAADDDLSDDQKAMIGKPAPEISLKGLDDKTVKLSDDKGSVVIVDFWATWCGPCVHSLPHLDALYKEKSGSGLKVLAVNLQEDKDKVAAFVKKQGWNLPIILDTEAAAASDYKATAIPETVVIGKDGTVKQIFVGGAHEEDIKKLVEQEMK